LPAAARTSHCDRLKGAELPVREVVSGLKNPWGVAFLPTGEALVTERDTRQLLQITLSGEVRKIGKVHAARSRWEGGLLGVAVSPNFRTDHYIYLYYTTDKDNRIVRLPYKRGRLGKQKVLVHGIPRAAPEPFHNGGRLAFGPDGMLYATTGEGGKKPLAQKRGSLGGKILRMTPAGLRAPGNPFRNLVWAYGLRNPQGLAWDSRHRLYATEFGEDRWDEVNRIVRGGNYGWPKVEGRGGGRRYRQPLITWRPAQASPSGLAIVGDSLWVGALRGQRLWEIPHHDNGSLGRPRAHFVGREPGSVNLRTTDSEGLAKGYGRLRTTTPAPDGTLWVTTSNQDIQPGLHGDKILAITVPQSCS
jgi:glucose/arabinose dehydrogenase